MIVFNCKTVSNMDLDSRVLGSVRDTVFWRPSIKDPTICGLGTCDKKDNPHSFVQWVRGFL